MDIRIARLIAVLFVFLFFTVVLAVGGCSSITMVSGAKDTDSYERISFRGPPKDFAALDFKFGDDTRLKAGTAATADQPWADVVADWGKVLLEARSIVAYCEANPALCADP